MSAEYPTFSEQGDHVQAALEERLAASGGLNQDELDGVCEIVAASYQQALQLRFMIEQLVATPAGGRERLADDLEAVEQVLNALSTLHATTRDKLYYAAQRIRTAP